MESSLIYIMILLLNMFEFLPGIVFNKGEKEYHFTCYNEGSPTDIQIIKLFLSTDNLKVHCFFRSENSDISRAILGIFTTGGIAPKMIVMNSTYNFDFHFNLSLFRNQLVWIIDIPRENITVNTDIAAVEQWIIKITMHEGLNIYDTEGTLLDLVREPVLQWSLGPIMNRTHVMELYPHVIDIIVTKCPCANDVALLGFILNSTYNGVYIGKTVSGFWKNNETVWYDMTDMIYTVLKDERRGLTVIDMTLTNHFLVILTSLGLFVSPDLRYPSTSPIQLSRAEFCGFERDDYMKGKLWYNERCFSNTESFEVDYITITFDRNRTLSESSSCFYSKEPFLEWLPCLDSTYESSTTVVTFLIDQESKTGIYLLRHQRSRHVTVSVSMLREEKPSPRPKFPNFKFPASFSHPVGMVFHPRSHFLYVYGDQVEHLPDIHEVLGLIPNTKKTIVSKIVLTAKNKSGNAYIRKVYKHTSSPLGFDTSVVAEILEPFGIEEISDSPCLSSGLTISSNGNNFYTLTLTSQNPRQVFKSTDVEKTVVKPGHSSFLITEIIDSWNALSIATMPHTVKSTLRFAPNTWFLYNFGLKGGRNWNIHLRPCNYWFQAYDKNFLSLSLVEYIDVGNKADFEFTVIPHVTSSMPVQGQPLSVIIGNPMLLEVKTEGHYDINENYHLKIDVGSKFSHKGSTSLALVLWDASTDCLVTTLVTTMKSSCSYLRTMHHVPDTYIPPEDWTSGVHEDSLGFNMIKTLPVNYRPPSNMGISIPLTDNFYHADPSKPIPRNLFQKSKETGKYKQCANATRREMCNCTEHQKFSHAVAFSDCKEKVHRYKFPVTQYPVVLEIFNEGEKFSMEPPYLVTVTEVNMRKNWEIKLRNSLSS
ncbi:cation channel sperm-associated auxiliary subunit beta [Psammomys obesus]|uniref:cation channel sperm-associated auxiliary subunit beta n=1 Tax=Psammomys obesus TaxID=48139 RepID=UPI002452A2D0|nr:cation channel sperm-associated auxiliary subunit beta [Psammomys obesus]